VNAAGRPSLLSCARLPARSQNSEGEMSLRQAMAVELRVAFSRKGQPVWFRVLKWVVFVSLGVYLWSNPYFWGIVVGAFLIGLGGHLVWRRKTRGWTRPWGGWNDLEASASNSHPEADEQSNGYAR
jgi:hypothetical protein